MAQKNENEKTPAGAKSVTEIEVTPVKPETDLDNQKIEQSEQTAKPAKTGHGATGDLSSELIELVTQ